MAWKDWIPVEILKTIVHHFLAVALIILTASILIYMVSNLWIKGGPEAVGIISTGDEYILIIFSVYFILYTLILLVTLAINDIRKLWK